MEYVEKIAGWVANLIQIGTFGFAIVALWQTRSRLKRVLRGLEVQQSARPMALAIGLGGGIMGQVEQYLSASGSDMKPLEVTREGMLPEEHYHEVLRDIVAKKRQLTDLGATEVHLFYKGPVTLPVAIGAILDNWVPIKVYEYKGVPTIWPTFWRRN